MSEDKVNYFDVDAISNSSITRFLIHPRFFYQDKLKAPKRHFDLGSAVDLMITEADRFDELIEVADYKKPSDTTKIGKFVSSLIVSNKEDKGWDEAVDIAIEAADYASKTKDKILAEFEEYRKYYERVTSSTKIILSYKELKLAKEIVKNLTKDQRTSKWFTPDEDEEVIFQKEIYWECLGLKCKSKLDIIKYNRSTNTLYVTDLKTTGGETFNFRDAIVRYSYQQQASFYIAACLSTEEYKDVEHVEYHLIVESTTSPGFPMCYKMSSNDIVIGAMGGVINGKRVKGFREALLEMSWHLEHDLWDYSKEYYENGVCETKLGGD